MNTMRNTLIVTGLLLALASCTNCASAPQVVKDEAHTVAGCDVGDVSAIIIANGHIVTDVAMLTRGGAAAAPAALDILAQLAVIHGAWAHCRATAAQTTPAANPPAGGVKPEATPTAPPAVSPRAPSSSNTLLVGHGLPPLIIHDAHGRHIVITPVQ